MLLHNAQFLLYKSLGGDFPGGPVVKTSPSNTEGVDLIPDQGSLDPICFRAKISKHKTEAML